jgi:hypothetical protein
MTSHLNPKSSDAPYFYPESNYLGEDLKRSLAESEGDNPNHQVHQDLLESMTYLKRVVEVDASPEFDFALRQKINSVKQAPVKSATRRFIHWQWGAVAAVFLFTFIALVPQFEGSKKQRGAEEQLVTAYLRDLSVDERLFALHAGTSSLITVSGVNLSREALDYPLQEIHEAPIMSF